MSAAGDRRRAARERKLLRSHSRWLQKVLFALSKAEGESAKLQKLRGEATDPTEVSINGSNYPIEDVTEALRETVTEWLESMSSARTLRSNLR